MAARQAARRGLHLLARSRHRLGRRRSRHQCRRAEGRVAAAAAHRPRQPPLDEPSRGDPGAGQPLRGAGMPRRARRRSPERAGHAAAAHRRARRAGAARARLRLRRAVPSPTSSIAEVTHRRALCRARRAPTSTRVVDFVATGGYALQGLRALRQDPAGPRTAAGASAIRASRSTTGMNVGTIVEADMLKVRLVRSRAGRGQPADRARRPAARRGRGIFRRDADAGRHLRVRRRGAALRGIGRERGLRLARRRDDDPKVPSYDGGKFPLSTYLADRVRGMLADPDAWRALPEQVREWLRDPGMALAAAGPRRAAGRDLSARRASTIWSAIRSKAGSRTRRSACC